MSWVLVLVIQANFKTEVETIGPFQDQVLCESAITQISLESLNWHSKVIDAMCIQTSRI